VPSGFTSSSGASIKEEKAPFKALRKRDTTQLGVVLNVLLAWEDCCFRPESVVHPHTRELLAFTPTQFHEHEIMPKERELFELCRKEKAAGHSALAYSIYTGTRDTASRLKVLLEGEDFKVAVLRARRHFSLRRLDR